MQRVGRMPLGPDATARANRSWWDAHADEYQREHGTDLEGFLWGPEGLREDDAGLLGDVAGRRVLEVGCGAAQCSRWLLGRGARPVGLDVSAGQLARAGRPGPSLVQGDARRLPFAAASFEVAFSAYGAVPFVADSPTVMREVRRVLRPGGRWVFSVPHPLRWCLPDDPGEGGLTVTSSYFDRSPYVELDEVGRAEYAEHHRTVGDRVREAVAAGFAVVDLVEPEWPDDRRLVWGGWSQTRGRLIPGTLIVVCVAVG